MVELKIKRLHSNAIMPNYAHEQDAGLDIYSIEDIIIKPGQRYAVHTGLSFELEPGYVALVWDKSGLALNKGIKTMAGVIDSSYRGEVKIVLLNANTENHEIKKGEKIAQILIQKIEKAEIIERKELSETQRGKGGFGSTGLKNEIQ